MGVLAVVPSGGEITVSGAPTTDPTLLEKDAVASAYRQAALARLGAARVDRPCFPVPHELDDNPDDARRLIELPRIPEVTIHVASAVAAHLISEVHTGSDSYCDRLRDAARSGGGLTTAELERVIAITLRLLESPLYGPEMTAVVAALCLLPDKVEAGKEREVGFLRNLPADFLDSGPPDECYVRLQTILRYFIVHDRGLTNARLVEESGVVTETRVFPAGLRNTTLRELSSLEMIEIAAPGITYGFDPPVRPWLRQAGEKWQGATGALLSTWGAAWACSLGMAIFDEASGVLKIAELKKMKLADQIQNFGLQGAVDTAETIKTYGDVIRVGCRVLAGKDVVGLGPGQLRPWELTSQGMWQRVAHDGSRLIDDVSIYLLDFVFPAKFPATRADDGKLSPRGLASVPRLQKEFDLAATDCLRASTMTVQEALQRVVPEAFGYASHQIKPWETQRLHMWDESGLFRKAAIYYAAELGIGTLDRVTLRYELTKEQFDGWVNAGTRGGSLQEYMKSIKAEVLSGFEKCAEANMSNVFCLIFGVEALPNVSNNPKTKVSLSVSRHLEDIGGTFRLVVELPKSAHLQAAQAVAQNDDVADLSKQPDENARVKSKHDGSTYDLLWDRLRKSPFIAVEQRRVRNRVLTLRLSEARTELAEALLQDADGLIRAFDLIRSKAVSDDKSSQPFRIVSGSAELSATVASTIASLRDGKPLKARAISHARAEIAKRINPDRSVESFFLEIAKEKTGVPTPHLDMARDRIQELREVKEQIFDNNLPLLLNLLGRQKDPVAAAEEIFPAVQYAIDTFDPTLGFEFSTRLIDTCNYMLRSVNQSDVPVTLNDDQARLLRRIREARVSEPDLTADEVATRWGVGLQVATALLALSRSSRVELDKPYQEGESGPQVANSGPSPVEEAGQREEQRLLRRAVQRLRADNPLYAQIIELRNGLTDRGVLTLDQIGEMIGRTGESVRQNEKKAVAALKKLLVEEGFANEEEGE